MNELSRFLVAFFLPPLVVFFSQAVLMRMFRGASAQLLTMSSMVLGYPLFFLIVSFMGFASVHDLNFYLFLFFLYSFSAYTYFHVFNMSETSRRVRMLSAISTAKLSQVDDLKDIYDDGKMIEVRLQRLVSLGQIVQRDGKFYPKGKLFTNTAVAFYTLGSILSRPWLPMRTYIERRKNA